MSKKKPNGYWNYSRCAKAAQKCKSRNEFNIKYKSAYQAAIKNKWLDNICSHYSYNHRKPKGYWNEKILLEIAGKYTTKKDFKYGNNAAYCAYKRIGSEKITKHMLSFSKPKGYWNKDMIIKSAKKCKTRTEFQNNYGRAYEIARLNGWLDEVCFHMKTLGNKYKRAIYAIEFKNNYVYVGLSHDIDERYNSHVKNGPVKKHMTKTKLVPMLKQKTKYIDVQKAKEKEAYWQRKYKHAGWIALHTAKPGGIGNGKESIFESIVEINREAKKYSTRKDFKKSSPMAYKMATRKGILDEVCSEYNGRKKKISLSKQNVFKEAKKYNTRTDFAKNSGGAYNKARREGWIDILFPFIMVPNPDNKVALIAIKNDRHIRFESIKEASRNLDIFASSISAVLRNDGRVKTAGGYTFKLA